MPNTTLPFILSRASQRILEGSILAIVLFLPLIFNSFGEFPFEPTKASFLRWACGLLCAVISIRFLMRDSANGDIPIQPIVNPLAISILYYAGILIVATLTSLDTSQSWWGLNDKHGAFTTLCAVAFCLVIGRLEYRRQQIERLIRAVLLASFLVSAYGLIQLFDMDPLPWITDSISPVHSTLGRSNFLGAYLAMVIPLTLYQLTREEHRLGIIVLLIIQVLCLFVTQARTGWLAAVIGCTIYVGMLGYRWQRHRLIYIAFVVLGLGLVLLYGQDRIRVREFSKLLHQADEVQINLSKSTKFSEENTSEVREASIQRRLIIWRSTFPLLSNRWLLGYGPEMFGTIFNLRYPSGSLYAGTDIIVDDPHNLILEQVFSTGILGLLALLAVIVFFYRGLWQVLWNRSDQKDHTLAAAVLSGGTSFLIQAQFNPDVIVLTTYFWLFVALAGRFQECIQNTKETIA